VQPADIGPISPGDQTQSTLDLFLIFVGANVVATTFQVGASLTSSFALGAAIVLSVVGSIAGAALVAALAPIGPRLRVPSVIAARPALGIRGAGLVAVVLYLSNFAWIALNNVIAASACVRVAGVSTALGVRGSESAWAIALGIIATVIVWRGPRAVARADRVAVPVMMLVAVALTIACLRARTELPDAPRATTANWWHGLDIVVGYQVSWILMFADYSRYTRSIRGSAAAVFMGLALTSAWMMPLGAVAARAARSTDPGAMLGAVGLGAAGALLLTIATLTTNFVNIYMSSLAWKSLVPRARDGAVIGSIGLIGTALSAVPGVWLEQYTTFMTGLAAVLVPVGGILIAHYYFGSANTGDPAIADLYDTAGPFRGVNIAGVAAWAAGAVAFFAADRLGGTMPALGASVVVYVTLRRVLKQATSAP